MNQHLANALLLLVGAIWGMGFVAQSTAMDEIGPVFFTGIRFLAAAICVLPLALWESRKIHKASGSKTTVKNYANYALLGTFLFASLATQQIGLVTTSVTNSGFLTGLYVVIVPILSVIILRRMPHFVIWPAALATLFGIYLLSGGDISALTRGDYWTILCAFLWACHVIVLSLILQDDRAAAQPFTLACTQFFVCAVWGILIGLLSEAVDWSSILAALPEILFAGIISGGVAFTLQAYAQRYTTAPQAAIFMSSEALFAALFGAVLLAERIGFVGLIGCMLIFTAMLMVELVPMLTTKPKVVTPPGQ